MDIQDLSDKVDLICVTLFGQKINGRPIVMGDKGFCGRVNDQLEHLKRQQRFSTRMVDIGIGILSACSILIPILIEVLKK